MNEIAHQQENHSKTIFGFWVYLMTDCIIFGMLFATYVVFRNATYGGPGAKDLFSTPFVLAETLILLLSSFASGLGGIAVQHKKTKAIFAWHTLAFLLGALFVGLELYEFKELYIQGNSWARSAFLSSFFTLVGTHGLHVILGLLWLSVLLFQLYFKGLTWVMHKRLTCFRLFWHFLDVVWIFIFTYVYLMGAV
jgi:cytochrome o ubiquinol oxidase subunit 3